MRSVLFTLVLVLFLAHSIFLICHPLKAEADNEKEQIDNVLSTDLSEAKTASDAKGKIMSDGIYSSSNKDFTVQVIIQDNKITEIEILKPEGVNQYKEKMAPLIKKIIEKQKVGVGA